MNPRCSEVTSLFSSLFDMRRKRALLDGFPVLLALQDLVDAYRDSRSALTMERERANITSCPHGVLAWRWFGTFSSTFSRANASSRKKRVLNRTLHINTWPLVLKSTPSSSESRHPSGWWTSTSQATPGSLNEYETNWRRYQRQQPDNNKVHLATKTGHQGHVHALPSWRDGPNSWAGGSDVPGMIDKEVVRALLERQDVNGLQLLLNRWRDFQSSPKREKEVSPQAETGQYGAHEQSTRVGYALLLQVRPHYARRRKLRYHRLPVCALCSRTGRSGSQCLGYALERRRGFGEGGLPGQTSNSPGGYAPGATYVTTTASSQPYTRPRVPRPVHVVSRFGPGLHAISVSDTSRESLTTMADLASSLRIQTESMCAMQLQMDDMLPPFVSNTSLPCPKPSVSAVKVAQIFDGRSVGADAPISNSAVSNSVRANGASKSARTERPRERSVRANGASARTERPRERSVRSNRASARTERLHERSVHTNEASARTERPLEPSVHTNRASARMKRPLERSVRSNEASARRKNKWYH